MLSYKCDWYGKTLTKIGRFEPSSKTCSECGNIKEELKLSERNWTCKNCGASHDIDVNAAINIKKIGLRDSGMWSSEESADLLPLGRAKKQKVFKI
jgi:putative transposase